MILEQRATREGAATTLPVGETVTVIRDGEKAHGLKRYLRLASQALTVVTLALVSYLVISHFFLQSVTVVGVSMFPTLHDSEHYLLNRWIFHVRSPHVNDVVVLCDPSDQGFSVKRVVAEAGDTVYIKSGLVFVNGRKLEEPYLPPNTPTYPQEDVNEQLFRCGPNQVFVLGDNRMNSIDSRVYGPVPRKNILGLIVQ